MLCPHGDSTQLVTLAPQQGAEMGTDGPQMLSMPSVRGLNLMLMLLH